MKNKLLRNRTLWLLLGLSLISTAFSDRFTIKKGLQETVNEIEIVLKTEVKSIELIRLDGELRIKDIRLNDDSFLSPSELKELESILIYREGLERAEPPTP
jgi:hypothetical protein